MYNTSFADTLNLVFVPRLADTRTRFLVAWDVFHVARFIDLETVNFFGVKVDLDAPVVAATA